MNNNDSPAPREPAILVWIKQILLIVALTFLISTLIIQTYDVNDVSMQPTFDAQGNRVLVFLTPYLFNAEPNHGDIVIVDSRVDRQRTVWDRINENPIIAMVTGQYNRHLWIKRVIGRPGDELEYSGGYVYRNGNRLEEGYTAGLMVAGFEPVKVPDDHIFIMGDNRNRSSDSRQVGPVPLHNVQGRVLIRLFPLDKISTF